VFFPATVDDVEGWRGGHCVLFAPAKPGTASNRQHGQPPERSAYCPPGVWRCFPDTLRADALTVLFGENHQGGEGQAGAHVFLSCRPAKGVRCFYTFPTGSFVIFIGCDGEDGAAALRKHAADGEAVRCLRYLIIK
jgi:hypothetical protein